MSKGGRGGTHNKEGSMSEKDGAMSRNGKRNTSFFWGKDGIIS